MKFWIFILAALGFSGSITAQNLFDHIQGPQFTVPVQAPISKVYTPKGFDDNDIPQFIVEGEFENACYSFSGVHLAPADRGKKRFSFFVQAEKIEDEFCPPEKKKIKNVPYFEVVNLPKLKVDKYEIWHPQKLEGPAAILEIEEAKNKESQDNDVYALVDSALIEKENLYFSTYIVTLFGEFIDSCHDIDIERSMAQPAGDHVVVILPVIKDVKADNCRSEKRRFARSLPLKDVNDVLKKGGRFLFHIRTMNGKSFNIIQTLTP